jgi:hypothetical protein
MSLPIDPGTAIPTHIQEFDGFDVATIDSNRWNDPTINGSTNIEQTGGNLVFTNLGVDAGISYYETIRTFGKNWRITTDLKITTTTGTLGTIALVLYKNSTCYLKMGPYKTSTIDCNCYLRYKNGEDDETGLALTGDVIDTTDQHNYTFAVINDTVIIYYDGIMITSIPFGEMTNYTVRIEAGTATSTDTLVASADDYEIINNIDTLMITIGEMVKEIHDRINNVGTSIVNDIEGTLSLTDTTEQFITLEQDTYGTKFKVNMFADLEGASIGYCRLYASGDGTFTDQDDVANSLQSNTVLLIPATGAAVGDCVYFGNSVIFNRLDVYMEQGISNTDNTYAWEYWNGSAWTAITLTADGTNNGKVFGKSGSVLWSDTLHTTTVNSILAYWVRARVTVLGSAKPKATHLQVSNSISTGFDTRAEFLSTLVIRIYRKRNDGEYATLPIDIGLPFTQCIVYRNVEISNLPAWSDIKIGFKLSETPLLPISIQYTGYAETIEG